MSNKTTLTLGGLIAVSMSFTLAAEPMPPVQQPTAVRAATVPPSRFTPSVRTPLLAQVEEPPRAEAVPPASAVPALGLQLEEVPRLLAYHLPLTERGVLIAQVQPNSRAANAGLGAGDIVLAVNDHLLNAGPQQLAKILTAEPGQPIRLLVLRAGHPQTLTWNAAVLPPTTSGNFQQALSISLSLPEGSVALAGANGRYRLDAQFRDANGQTQRLRHEGTFEEIKPLLEQLPNNLKKLTQQQIK